jgi:protein SCO1
LAFPAHCRRWAALTIVTMVALLSLSACGTGATDDRGEEGGPVAVTDLKPDLLHGTVVDSLARPSQVLHDTSGRPYSVADRPQDGLTILFFGYTHCPDVCPTTMADLAAARAQLPESLRARVEVVFVTEDPERDTNTALRRWLDRYDPSFVGLRGGNAASRALLDELYLPQTKLDPAPEKAIKHPGSDDGHHHDHGRYGIEHASVVYAFGPREATVIYTSGAKPSQYAADFTRLLDPGARIR